MLQNFQIPNRQVKGLPIGYYTIVYPEHGTHRTIRVKKYRESGMYVSAFFAGKTVIGYLTGSDNTKDYTNIAFYGEDGSVNFFKSFLERSTIERVNAVLSALRRIVGDVDGTGKAYALASERCYRCNRLLTNPESIDSGIGPECVKKAA